MSTTLVHIGDFHAAPGPRNAERYATLDQIIGESLRLPRLGAWVWPGDLFDGLSTVDDRNAIDARLRRMAQAAAVVIVEGNHDRPGDLRGFANLSGAHPIIVVDERPQTIRLPLATGEWASIFCVPYPHKHGLVGAGVAHGAIVETAGHLLDPIFLAAAAALETARANGDITLCLFHANIAGAIASTGQPNVGQEIELTQQLLDRLGPIYKGGNHIHRPQEISGAWYAGSTARKDYGEVEDKRFLLVHYGVERDAVVIADDREVPQWMYTVESRPLRIPPMYLVEGWLSRDGFTLFDERTDQVHFPSTTDDVALRFAQRNWADADVRVQYSYLASERAVLDPQVVHTLFASALRLKVQGVVVPDREVRAVAVSAAKTIPDKLAAMRPDGVLPAAVVDKVTALQQQDREAVLANVRAWLASIETSENAAVAA